MSITEIKREVLKSGGTFELQKMQLNGKKCYRVNGNLLTRDQVIEHARCGAL